MKSHLSEEQISQWIAGQQSREVECHLRECPDCSAEVGQTANALRLFRESGFQSAEYWQNQPAVQPARKSARWVLAGAAFAAVTLVAVAFHRPPAREPHPTQEVFLPIPYVVPPAPYERTEVVRMDVPVAALIAAGFTMKTPAADSVSADVLIGQDGRPMAVGFPENIQ